jgi:alpha-D-ribose 1-methylphosphonate 5-triphosphate synthase subunit PhnG
MPDCDRLLTRLHVDSLHANVIEISFSYVPIAAMENQNHSQERARWISLLAKAPATTLAEAVAQYGELPKYEWLRRPETGLAMVRARAGGTGGQFNLGEMSITRCAVRLANGEMGIAYVAGRSQRHAEWAAVFDALLQTSARERVRITVLHPIESALAAQRAETATQARATKVDFMTMVRGEDA